MTMVGYILLGISIAFAVGVICFFAGIKYGVDRIYNILFDKIYEAQLEEIGSMFIKLGYTEQFKEAMSELSKEHNEQTK